MKRSALWGGVAVFALFASGCYQAPSPQSTASTSAGSTASTSAGSMSSTVTAKSTAVATDAAPLAAQAAGDAAAKPAPAASVVGPEVVLAEGLKYVDLKVGDGDIAESGMTAKVQYTGWLTDGTKFDSGIYPFQIGAGGVIRGWDVGVKGMRIGGKRKLTIPPGMAYGDRGYPPVIPANATLLFDVELLGLSH